MFLKHLHQRTALRFILNMTNRTIRVTQSYMTTWHTVTATDLAQKWSNSKWSSYTKERSISYHWYVRLYEYVPWATPPTQCSSFQSQRDELYRSTHPIIYDQVVSSHSHGVLTWLEHSRTQNDRHVRRRGQLHMSNTFTCANMSLEQLHELTAFHLKSDVTSHSVRLTLPYLATWCTTKLTILF